jgi:hypothetical protein
MGRAGIEPATIRLKVGCSTNELPARAKSRFLPGANTDDPTRTSLGNVSPAYPGAYFENPRTKCSILFNLSTS